MDYKRVYAEFIKSRREREGHLEGHTERHHIVPRQVGGTDALENLISLSAADHFFAHLLLARIYGGRLWVPVILWCGGDRGNWRARKSRLNYEWAAKAATKRLKGKGAWQYDHTIHCLHHKDGRVIRGTQYDLAEQIGGLRSGLNQLLKRKVPTYLGWYLEGFRPDRFGHGRAGNNHNMADTRVHHFVHSSGEEFVGTRFEFRQRYGLPTPNICHLVNRQRIISRGWTLKGAVLPRVGRAHAKSQKAKISGDARGA